MFEFKDPDLRSAKIFSPIAAIAPAALFAVLWRWLNVEFPPFLPSGFNTPFECLIAGIWFWDKTCSSVGNYLQQGETEGLVKSQVEKAYWGLITAAVAIPFGRVVFSFVPPWDNGIGAILGVAIGNTLLLPGLLKAIQNRFVHNRGTVLLSEQEAKRQIRNLPAGTEPRIKWAGNDLPGEVAEGNLLCAGTIGTGKTRMHRELMASVVPSIKPGADRRLLIYDVKCDLLSELPTMLPEAEVIVFNPFDTRSVAWDIAGDVQSSEQASQFAEAFIVPGKNDKQFFTDAARAIVKGVIDKLNADHPRDWTLRGLILILSSQERLERVLKGSDLIDEYFSPPDTFANVKNTIANTTRQLRNIAALWEKREKKISLTNWVKRGDSILVFAGKENLQASLEPLNRIAFKMISSDFLSEGESPRRARLWFFCDELKTAGRLDGLADLMNSRSKGVRCVLGFQDLEGLIKAYDSRETANEIIGRCKTISWLKLNTNETAKWASERSGEFERYEYLDTRSKEGASVGEHLTKRESLLPSEFMFLPDFADGNAHGIHLIKGVNGVFKSKAHYEFQKTDVKDFDPRPDSEQVLAPWNDDDDNWLDGGTSKPSPNPDSDGPSLGSIGRVDF